MDSNLIASHNHTSTKINAGRYFEDFMLNEVIAHATPRTITSGDCALYIALYGARHPLHCSVPFAQSLGYKTTPVDDLLAFHLAFGKTVPDISVNAVANLGYADVRFIAPLFVGDTLSTQSQVIGLKQNSNGKNGIVWVRSTAVNQHQQVVLSWVRWVMVHKKNLSLPAPITTIPHLPAFVVAENLNVLSGLQLKNFDAAATGGQYFWEDYQLGETLAHDASMLINDSDHALATRLYQNNAKLHFNHHLSGVADGIYEKPLVYGGVIISMCRALSFDGLENAISILAINAGTHLGKSFAGDTIYTSTKVLDKFDLPNQKDAGALRLQMLAFNKKPLEIWDAEKALDEHHPHAVLNVDYTVLMPKRIS